MKIHEYQAKAMLRRYGVAVPDGRMVTTVEEAVRAAQELATPLVVVKAQIHAGGRGKGGGVRLARNHGEVREHAAGILGMRLVTHQTGPEGQTVRRLLIEAGCDIQQEFYLAAVLDRARQCVSFIASREGGMEIEEVAAARPEAIFTQPVNPITGYTDYIGRKLGRALGLNPEQSSAALPFFRGLYQAFVENDCGLLEINPLVLTKAGALIALDAKVVFDDNAAFRHKEWDGLIDEDEESPSELEAAAAGLSYIKLDGEIGCLVNGAGLAMATMDIIKHCGREPANFLDVGGTATPQRVATAFKIILSDPNVKAIFVNIFGGIVRCDVIAQGILAAAREVHIGVPLVVRLEGNNADKAQELLNGSGLAITSVQGLAPAAKRTTELLAAGR